MNNLFMEKVELMRNQLQANSALIEKAAMESYTIPYVRSLLCAAAARLGASIELMVIACDHSDAVAFAALIQHLKEITERKGDGDRQTSIKTDILTCLGVPFKENQYSLDDIARWAEKNHIDIEKSEPLEYIEYEDFSKNAHFDDWEIAFALLIFDCAKDIMNIASTVNLTKNDQLAIAEMCAFLCVRLNCVGLLMPPESIQMNLNVLDMSCSITRRVLELNKSASTRNCNDDNITPPDISTDCAWSWSEKELGKY